LQEIFFSNIAEANLYRLFWRMFQQLLNWRTLLALIAILIVSGTVWYSSYLGNKIEREERDKVELWVEAGKSLINPANTDTRLPLMITTQKNIPIIETTERDSIMQWINLDSTEIEENWLAGDTLKNPNTNAYSCVS
jgi:hypothetical protein